MNTSFVDSALFPAWQDARLEFALPRLANYKSVLTRLSARGQRSFVLHPDGDSALREAVSSFLTSSLGADAIVPESARTDAVHVYFETNAEACSSLLMNYIDRPATVVVPRTAHHFSQRPIFCVSIPKAGFHLVARVLSDMGFTHRGRLTSTADPQCAYLYLHDHSHLTCNELFTELAHEKYGGAESVIFRYPVVFCYRHPADIVISEARYYAESSATALATYFGQLPFDRRLRELISDDGMIGTLRDRVASYKEWMELPNVLPIAFEDIVGEAGGGSAALQQATVWSLQLKLHVPGQPREFVRYLFGDSNQTFRKGQIGGFRTIFKPEHYEAMDSLDDTDFLERFGYGVNLSDPAGQMSSRSTALRRRPLMFRSDEAKSNSLAEPAITLAGETLYRWHGYYVGILRSRCCAIEPGQPRFDPFVDETRARHFVATDSASLEQLLAADSLANEPQPVRCVSPSFEDVFRTRLNVQPLFPDVDGYSIVRIGEKVIGIPSEIGELSGDEADLSLVEGLIIGRQEEEVIARIRDVTGSPWLVEERFHDHNIVEFQGLYYGIPLDLGAADLTQPETRALEAIPRDAELEVVKARIVELETERLNDGLPHLVCDGYHGFNIVYLEGSFYGILQSVGEFDLLHAEPEQLAGLISGPSRAEVQAVILGRTMQSAGAANEYE